MSKFMQRIDEHQKRIEEEARLSEQGTPLTYPQMLVFGMLKPVNFRLPITTAAQLDVLLKYGPWETKQQMVAELLMDTIEDFLSDPNTHENVRKDFQTAGEEAFNEWKRHHRDVADNVRQIGVA
jgi:hypothetical protein